MAKKKKPYQQPKAPEAAKPEPTIETPPAPPPPTTLTLIDANQPKGGALSWALGDNVVNTSLVGSRFDYLVDSGGRFISVADSESLYGNPIHGLTMSCDASQSPQSFYLADSTNGLWSFQRSPSPGDVEVRAAIAPGLFKALLDAQLAATTGKTLIQHDAAEGNAIELTVPRSPIEALCNARPIQDAIRKNAEIKR